MLGRFSVWLQLETLSPNRMLPWNRYCRQICTRQLPHSLPGGFLVKKSTYSTDEKSGVKHPYNPETDLPAHLQNLKVLPTAFPVAFFLFVAIVLLSYRETFTRNVLGIGKEEDDD